MFYLNGEQPPWDLQHRSAAEILREEFDVDGGRHENEPQVGAVLQQRAKDPEQEVTVEVSLVDLVHNHHLVLGQRLLLLDLSQQETLSQEEQLGGRGPSGLKADLVPNLEETGKQLVSNVMFGKQNHFFDGPSGTGPTFDPN